jgi:hypothetical protein
MTGDNAAGHRGLLVDVVARAYPVVSVSDPQRIAMYQEHGGQLLASFDLPEVGGHLRIVRAKKCQTRGSQKVCGRIVLQLLLFA